MTLRKLGERKWKAQSTTSYLVVSLKIQFFSYLVENSQKATLNFYFKSRFSVKHSKFQIYFAKDCRFIAIISQENQGIYIHVSWYITILLWLHKKWSFPWRISSINVIQSAENWGFGQIYWKNLQWKSSIFVKCLILN